MTLTGRDVLLPTIIVLFVLTLALMLALKWFVAPRYGKDVEARFLERINHIPSQGKLLSEPTLARWLADKSNDKAISGYVVPVLFPLDILFLLCLGLFLGLASGALADRLGFLSNIPTWIWWILPTAYMASDLAEDTVVAAIFKSFISLTANSFRLLSTLTAIKIATVSAAIGQVAFLGALNALLFFFPPAKVD